MEECGRERIEVEEIRENKVLKLLKKVKSEINDGLDWSTVELFKNWEAYLGKITEEIIQNMCEKMKKYFRNENVLQSVCLQKEGE